MKKLYYTLLFCAASITGAAQSFPKIYLDESEIGVQIKKMHYESAEKTINAQITAAKRKKQSTTVLDQQKELCEKGLTALKGTDKIAIIDSVVVDKKSFLSAYRMSSDLGNITLSQNGENTSFTPERAYFSYKTEVNPTDSTICVKKYILENGAVVSSSPLNGIDLDGDINYPFLMSDGITFYFASRSKDGFGNYDIYVTRYDSEDDRYLQPTNLGYPFNSYANDYMMVVDEQNGVGFFASDRNQPEDKVCVYTFIYNSSRHTYDWETDNHSEIVSAAKIASIRNTWKNVPEEQLRRVRQNLVQLTNLKEDLQNYEFSFVINDLYTYHYTSDFKKLAALTEFKNYRNLQKESDDVKSQLDELRTKYRNASPTAKDAIKKTILDLEGKLLSLSASIHKSEKQVRKLELQ